MKPSTVRKVRFTIPVSRIAKRKAELMNDAVSLLMTAAATCRQNSPNKTLDLVRGAQLCLIKYQEMELILKGEI